MLILISDAFDKQLAETLTAFGEVTDDTSRQAEAEVILIRSKTKVTREYIDAAPNLKLVIRGGVGLDNVDLVYAKEKGIGFINGVSTPVPKDMIVDSIVDQFTNDSLHPLRLALLESHLLDAFKNRMVGQ